MHLMDNLEDKDDFFASQIYTSYSNFPNKIIKN